MALDSQWTQQLLSYKVTLEPPSKYFDISRVLIDGTLVVYDPNDVPNWLEKVLEQRDEDGNVERKVELTNG